ncbi:MAG TPA: hypothetical protein VKA76_02010 [Gammaproteobacteria bacterium]|nr:hypothetical protein [Gammaproteobacteria bacterium]
MLKMKFRPHLTAMLAVALAGAAPIANASVHSKAILKADNGADFLFTSLHQQYKEYPLSAAQGNKETGSITGGALDLKGLGSIGLYTRLRTDYNRGNTDYVGHTLGGTPVAAKTHNQILNLAFQLGWGFGLGQRAALIPYAGVDVRAWRRAVDYGTPASYDEIYDFYDVGAGLLGQYAVTPKLVVSANAFVGRTHSPQMEAGLPQQLGGVQTYNQGTGPVDRARLSVDYDAYGPVHLVAGVTYYHLAYGESNHLQNTSYEPASRTNQLIYEVGVGVHL